MNNTASLTKQDFIALADILRSQKASDSLVDAIVKWLKSQNPRFDVDIFRRAITGSTNAFNKGLVAKEFTKIAKDLASVR